MGLFYRKKEFPLLNQYPQHLAIILDGNGRWAQRRGMPRSYGHLKGSENLRKIALASKDFGIKVLTVYAFSTENWKRPKDEVEYLFSLLDKFFNEFFNELFKNEVRVIVSGFIDELPQKLQQTIKTIVERTKEFSALTMNICLNYGASKELVMAVKKISEEVKNNKLRINEINEATIDNFLFTASLPPVDLLIRTGGDKRLSNFLLYQLSYSELYFCDTLWPDFNKNQLYLALKDFSKRQRRYGGIKK